jgi:hypothetical protein
MFKTADENNSQGGRGNPYHGPDGRFTTAGGAGGGGARRNATVYPQDPVRQRIAAGDAASPHAGNHQEPIPWRKPGSAMTPSEQANRNINEYLAERFSPGGVYEQFQPTAELPPGVTMRTKPYQGQPIPNPRPKPKPKIEL